MLIAEKEKKSSSYATSKLDKLSEEKQAKIKKYAKDFFAKAMHKIEKKRSAKAAAVSPSSSSLSQSWTSDPRRAHSSGSTSTASSATLRPELSIKIEDVDAFGLDGEEAYGDMVDEIFGKDDESTLNATPDGDIDGDQLTVDSASALNTPVDGEALVERDHRIMRFEELAMK